MSEADQGTDFEAFVLETSAVFSRVARAEAGDPHSAEDAVQIAYMRMFTSWEKIVARPGNRTAYGRIAVKNAVKDQFRRNRHVSPAPLQELPEQESRIGIPDAAYEFIKEDIDALVAKLPDRQRQVVTLCVLQDMSPEEAGKRLGLKEESVTRYIRIAIKNLKKYVHETGEEGTA
ncbi:MULTISPECIES: RNA polymerase sigma factor [unclassified Streptomyces]|uniref:RNA polymerase sigma factor n=1 Tax=unclassified Streptomyces TaxID=2593676 RepID=UPI000BF046DC|nr:sigma-70 family RNA polymerase sigma factor [Streptomyces sp. rh34]